MSKVKDIVIKIQEDFNDGLSVKEIVKKYNVDNKFVEDAIISLDKNEEDYYNDEYGYEYLANEVCWSYGDYDENSF